MTDAAADRIAMSRATVTRALVAMLVLVLAAGCTSSPGAAGTAGTGAAGIDASPLGAPSSAGPIPAALSFSVENDAVGEALVTFEAGGTVMASAADGTTFELVVPARALIEDTVIRMTPLTEVDGFGDGPVHAVRLEPEGLEFFAVARLTITPSTPIPIVDQLMFQATGTGDEVSAALVDVASEPIVILVQHFSLAGVGLAQGQAVWLEAGARSALKRIGHEVATNLQAERKRLMAGGADQVDAMDEVSRLFDDADRDVLGPLREAALLSCTATTAYIGALRNLEYQRSLVGLQNDDTGAATVAESARASEASFSICEREAIQRCKAKPDSEILIRFWIGWERQQEFLEVKANLLVDDFVERAKRICDPQGYQFEFSGEGTGTDRFGAQVEVVWHYWGLLCEGSEEWKIWEYFRSEGGPGSVRVDTGPPGADQLTGPFLVTFGEDGAVTHGSWPGYADGDRYLQQSQPRATISGTTFTLMPPDEPTEVRAELPVDITSIPVTAPVIPADGSIPGCEPFASP